MLIGFSEVTEPLRRTDEWKLIKDLGWEVFLHLQPISVHTTELCWFVETLRSNGGCCDTLKPPAVLIAAPLNKKINDQISLSLLAGRPPPQFYYTFNSTSAWLVSVCVIWDWSDVCSETKSTKRRGISAFIPLLQHHKLTEKCCYRDLSLDHSCSSQPTQQESCYVNENNNKRKKKQVKKKLLWNLSGFSKSHTF